MYYITKKKVFVEIYYYAQKQILKLKGNIQMPYYLYIQQQQSNSNILK